MIRNTVLIAGGGQAGASAAFRLRANGYDGEILIVCGENALPYQRPPLSKRYLIGSDGPDSLVLRPLEAYHKAGISLALGQCVVAINRDAASVTLDDGRILDFRHLILATGGSAVPLPASIAKGFANIHTFRSLADADLLGGQVGPARRMLIIGGGYIGLEMAAVARQSGMEVTVVEQAPRILQRVAALETADFFRDMHRARGVEILEGTRLAELTGADPLIADTACLEDGREISFDVAVVGIGIRPETGLAGAAGLRVEDGIVVDAHGRTDDKSIYAVGDCSNFPYKGGRLRLESVHNAIAQAEHAADVICGMDRSGYDPVPWFWSDQYDAKLQIAGLNKGYDQTIRRPGRREGGMSIWYFREGQFLAVDAINDPQAFMTGKRWLEASTCPPIERIADVTLDLKQVA